jgi:hypothetical protein
LSRGKEAGGAQTPWLVLALARAGRWSSKCEQRLSMASLSRWYVVEATPTISSAADIWACCEGNMGLSFGFPIESMY